MTFENRLSEAIKNRVFTKTIIRSGAVRLDKLYCQIENDIIDLILRSPEKGGFKREKDGNVKFDLFLSSDEKKLHFSQEDILIKEISLSDYEFNLEEDIKSGLSGSRLLYYIQDHFEYTKFIKITSDLSKDLSLHFETLEKTKRSTLRERISSINSTGPNPKEDKKYIKLFNQVTQIATELDSKILSLASSGEKNVLIHVFRDRILLCKVKSSMLSLGGIITTGLTRKDFIDSGILVITDSKGFQGDLLGKQIGNILRDYYEKEGILLCRELMEDRLLSITSKVYTISLKLDWKHDNCKISSDNY